jgi:hypothetical protein
MQVKRVQDRQAAVWEVAKRHPAIGMHFTATPTEPEVLDFGMRVRAQRVL